MKVGIVGTGVGIRTHLAGIRHIDALEVAGVVGTSIPRTRELLTNSGDQAELAVDWDQLLSMSPDIICITTALANREEYIDGLSTFPGYILFEKPLVHNKEHGDRLRTALGDSANRAFVNFQLRGFPAFQKIRRLIQQNALGKPYSITLFERTSAFRSTLLPEWMQSCETGGGQAYAMGSHLVDLASYLLVSDYSEISERQITGMKMTPRAKWEKNASPFKRSDEFFSLEIEGDNCEMHISTTSISVGPRSLEFRIECTEGSVEFCYRNQKGILTVWQEQKDGLIYYVDTHGGLSTSIVEEMLDPSAFRVAYPGYMQMLIDAINDEAFGEVATFENGVSNSIIIERAT